MRAQACKPHRLVFPQSLLHLISREPHGTFLRMTWFPTHSLAVGAVQGGHSPKWQVWVERWPHGWGIEQGCGQEGGGVPQATGGGIAVFPHAQDSSVKVDSKHGGQWPL